MLNLPRTKSNMFPSAILAAKENLTLPQFQNVFNDYFYYS